MESDADGRFNGGRALLPMLACGRQSRPNHQAQAAMSIDHAVPDLGGRGLPRAPSSAEKIFRHVDVQVGFYRCVRCQ